MRRVPALSLSLSDTLGASSHVSPTRSHLGAIPGDQGAEGSHHGMEALARSDRRKYRYMWALNLDVHTLDLGAPVELTPRRGDVLLYHYLCVHAGTTNLSEHPRLALRKIW